MQQKLSTKQKNLFLFWMRLQLTEEYHHTSQIWNAIATIPLSHVCKVMVWFYQQHLVALHIHWQLEDQWSTHRYSDIIITAIKFEKSCFTEYNKNIWFFMINISKLYFVASILIGFMKDGIIFKQNINNIFPINQCCYTFLKCGVNLVIHDGIISFKEFHMVSLMRSNKQGM